MSEALVILECVGEHLLKHKRWNANINDHNLTAQPPPRQQKMLRILAKERDGQKIGTSHQAKIQKSGLQVFLFQGNLSGPNFKRLIGRADGNCQIREYFGPWMQASDPAQWRLAGKEQRIMQGLVFARPGDQNPDLSGGGNGGITHGEADSRRFG
jgi:hypothetical protein